VARTVPDPTVEPPDDDGMAEMAIPWSRTDRPIPRTVVQPLQAFLHTEVASGVLLLAAALVALIWANSPVSESYTALFETEIEFRVGSFVIAEDLAHWINDLLMAFFFFVVGLEVKRELVHGTLREPRAALLPIVCALGGMIAPALLYTAFNVGGEGASGWGIPMATDIAFAVGVLALVGRRAPASLKIFLLTLAVADDLGAIAVIAVFYTGGIEFGWLGAAVVLILAIVGLQRLSVRAFAPYAVIAVALWYSVYSSGVHPTIAGVALGLLTPAWPFQRSRPAADDISQTLQEIGDAHADDRIDEREQVGFMHVSQIADEAVSPLARLEHALHPWTSYLVLPLFALANAGVSLSGVALGDLFGEPVTIGVVVGLVLGKPLGVMAAAALVVLTGRARLPFNAGWLELAGVALLAGIGFTVSIFVAGLAFEPGSAVEDAAKVGILAASVIAGLLGAGFLAARDAAKTGG